MIETPNQNMEFIVPETNNTDARMLAGLNAMLGEIGIPPRNSLAEVAAMPTDVESMADLRAGKAVPMAEQGLAATTHKTEPSDAPQPVRVMYAAAAMHMANFTQEQYKVALSRGKK